MGWLARHRKPVIAGLATLIVLGGIAWAVVASSSPREAGEEITGQGVGAGQVQAELTKAQAAEDKGNDKAALTDVRSILTSEPTQPQALTIEGWLLAQETNQPSLVTQGIDLLKVAEQVDPSFVEPHVYLASVYLSRKDDKDAIPELKWYLAHKPDPALAPKIKAALAKAEATVAKNEAKAKGAPAKVAPVTTAPASS